MSTFGYCDADSECVDGGCSGEVCESVHGESMTTPCLYEDCYDDKKYSAECRCYENKCQWIKINKEEKVEIILD